MEEAAGDTGLVSPAPGPRRFTFSTTTTFERPRENV